MSFSIENSNQNSTVTVTEELGVVAIKVKQHGGKETAFVLDSSQAKFLANAVDLCLDLDGRKND